MRSASDDDSDDAVATLGRRRLALAIALGTLVAAVLLISYLRIGRSWPRESHLGYAEGIWIGIAIDAAKGVFYRPLEGPLGYGGTRYFPLFFGLHGLLIRVGVTPIIAGHALAALAVILLVAAIFVFLRRTGASLLLSTAGSAVALACQPVQMALLTIRGDALPAALSIMGLSACLRPEVRLAAPLLFTLAFAAKPTSLYAPAGAVITMLLLGRRSDALRIAAGTAVGMALVLVVMAVVSGNRVFGVLAASAAGGAAWHSLAGAPLSLARILRRTPEVVFLLQLAAAWLLARGRRALTLEVLTGVVCCAATAAIYASPATVENHLIDLTVMAVLVLVAIAGRDPRAGEAVMALLLVGGLAAVSQAAWRFGTEDTQSLRYARLDALSAVADARRPVFFEQPMLPAHLGEPSYLVDPYQFSTRVSRDRTAMIRLLRDLDDRTFGALVLEHPDPALSVSDLPLEAAHDFLAALDRNYRLHEIVDGRAIYRPR
ncbi:MAG: hypothetical protein ABI051_17405 [Vicinamibacterales bacterium]